jgi:hypothetical protein
MPSFQSSTPGRPDDLPFTVTEFISACTAARSEPSNTTPSDWAKLTIMYSHIKLLRIDLIDYLTSHLVVVPYSGLTLINSPLYNLFLSEISTTPPSHSFDLPFTSTEFIEACQLAYDATLVIRFRIGIRKQIMAMIHDLATHKIDIRAFITGTKRRVWGTGSRGTVPLLSWSRRSLWSC